MTKSRNDFCNDAVSAQKAHEATSVHEAQGVHEAQEAQKQDRSGQEGQGAQNGGNGPAEQDKRSYQSDSSEYGETIKKRVPNNISSSISGVDAVGDDVAEKRANLLGAQSAPQLGRRESPEPYDPWPRRKMYIQGMVFGAIVIICVLVVIVVLGSGSTIGV